MAVRQEMSMNSLTLGAGDSLYGALRKPDFQRETAEWDPKRVVGLIRTFIEGELIPAVILWQNRELHLCDPAFCGSEVKGKAYATRVPKPPPRKRRGTRRTR
jgi:hypothetical protein